jgi:septal ring factor EnvC (AmiA/AmiB activator)
MSTDDVKPRRRPIGWIIACGVLAVAAAGLAVWAFSAQSDADDAQEQLNAQEQAAAAAPADAEAQQQLEQLASELGATGESLDEIEQQLEQAAAKVQDAEQAREDAGNAIDAAKAEAEAFKAQFELTQTCLRGTLDAVQAAFADGGVEAAVQELEKLSGNCQSTASN